MTERVVQTITSPDGMDRVLIVARSDGAYGYRRQWRSTSATGHDWGVPGPLVGIYDSEAAAIHEGLARVPWPQVS
jgi:hypothetical protein